MKNRFPSRLLLVGALLLTTLTGLRSAAAQPRWTPEQANAWSHKTGWLIGCNFSPSTAINQLEMWQPETFDLPTIDRELGWAEKLGFNSTRVFLHNLLWKQDPEGFTHRMDQFLKVADRHHIGVIFVPLDSCWDPYPQLGKQRDPKPGLHNSGWVQAPGREILQDPARHDELKGYIQGVIRRFRKDRRVQAWDLINEPDNTNGSSYGKQEPPHKAELALELLKKVFDWAREVNPQQPLTSAVWAGDWSSTEKLSPMARVQLDESDVISFHNYGPLPDMRKRVEWLERYGRPLICTEYMARPMGSTFQAILPFLKELHVGAYNWGFVSGKTQTIYPWDSWQKPYAAEPPVWFHDVFRADGSAYRPEEVRFIRELTGKAEKSSRRPLTNGTRPVSRVPGVGAGVRSL